MMQLLVARFPQSVIVSELVAGSLRRRQDGFWTATDELPGVSSLPLPHFLWGVTGLMQNWPKM
jgi:hypothetical protein